MNNTKIGIIGLGFVGTAIANSIYGGFFDNLVTIDNDPSKGTIGTYEDLESTCGVFVCVPSPMGEDGSCDTSILESVLNKLKDYKGVIICKSTIPPSIYKKYADEMPNLVHAPEFLTAANADRDYITGTFSFIGGTVEAYIREAERIIRMTQPNLKTVIHCTIEEAALAKYTINSFLATKVIFMNELHKLADSMGVSYETVASMVTVDPRIGTSHMKVPGPDGQFGFGGACFPKDTSALLKIAEENGVQLNVLDAAVKKNTMIRLTSDE